MRDFTVPVFLLIGGTLGSGFLFLAVFGAGVPALFGAFFGFVLSLFLLGIYSS